MLINTGICIEWFSQKQYHNIQPDQQVIADLTLPIALNQLYTCMCGMCSRAKVIVAYYKNTNTVVQIGLRNFNSETENPFYCVIVIGN